MTQQEELFDSKWEKKNAWEGDVLVTTVNETVGENPRHTVLRRYLKDGELELEMRPR